MGERGLCRYVGFSEAAITLSPFDRALDKFFTAVVERGLLHLTRADGSTRTFGRADPDFPEVSIRLTEPATARQLVLDPRLGAGEAIMDGRVVIENEDILGLVELFRNNRPWDRGAGLETPGLGRRLRNRVGHLLGSFNAARSSRSNVAAHYDIGNDLYRLFLDKRMQYSCAYWPRPDMTLDEAQEAKLAHIAAKLAIRPGQRVLDIGCGWGGMAIYLAQATGALVTGITLSEEQLALAQVMAREAGVADKVTFELIDYRDMAKRGDKFDRIVSVGMFEHVGQPQFGTFFRACAKLLADDGVMLLHTIGRMGEPGVTDAFTRKYIFPGGYIPSLSETVAASEPVRLLATDVEMLRLHYAWTLRAWYARCVANREQIIAMYDARFYRMWLFYLAGAATGFENSGLCNYQIQYVRDRHAIPVTRDWIGEAEAGLIAWSDATNEPAVAQHLPA